MQVEWNPQKAVANLSKHRVSFEEASTVLGDPLALTIADPDHSMEEQRFLTTGRSVQQRIIIVAHTYRNGVIRIIKCPWSARNERKLYESEA